MLKTADEKKSVAVVGAGVAGRMLAWRLLRQGYRVSIFDRLVRDSHQACSFVAAGILSPYAELDMAEPTIYELGSRSLTLYASWLSELQQAVFFKKEGSLVVAHGADRVDLNHFSRLVETKLQRMGFAEDALEKVDLTDFSQNLAHFGAGLFCPNEGQIDPIELMQALAFELEQHEQCQWFYETNVTALAPYTVEVDERRSTFDWVFDCRGLAAKEHSAEQLSLRGVRGELLWLDAPDVNLQHLVRLMHPRYRIYIVPRPNNVFLVGATEIESEDYSPVSVRSSLELLSAVYSVDKGFGEARIIKQLVQCRPALPDNLPCCELEEGLGRINGLYRHGILLSPALVENMVQQLEQHELPARS